MEILGRFRRLTAVQRNTFIACFLGWSLDAFDFFYSCVLRERAGYAVSCQGFGRLGRNFLDARDAASGCVSVWDDGRSIWEAAYADGRHRCLFPV